MPLFIFPEKDSHETPDLELGGEAETEAGSIKGTAEVTESRAMKGETYWSWEKSKKDLVGDVAAEKIKISFENKRFFCRGCGRKGTLLTVGRNVN